jgi:predicted transcriptional regulator
MKTTTFTTTISPHLLGWMNDYAAKTKRTRRAVLEDALTKYRAEEIRERMRTDFAQVTKDAEILQLSEWGMDDYHKIVSS